MSDFPDAIEPYISAYEQSVVGIKCWELIDTATFETMLEKHGNLKFLGLPNSVGRQVALSVGTVRELITGGANSTLLISFLTQQLIGHCWEIMKQHPNFPKRGDPVLEFYRHVRNGCFHGNRFNLRQYNEPRFCAKWRGKVITLNLEDNGVPVFQETTPVCARFLKWGDAPMLIADACKLVYY